MLTVTPTAAEAVQLLVAVRDPGEAGGLRISARESPEPGAELEIDVVGSPEAADARIESRGARVFLEPAVTAALADKVLDARVLAGRVRFAVLAPPDGAPGT